MDLGLLQRRYVSRSDWPLVLDWRNQPDVYINMATPRVIDIKEHMAWFDSRSKNLELEPLFGYYLQSELAATTRLDFNKSGHYEVGIIVSPNFRGLGVAFYCLTDTVNFFYTTLAIEHPELYAIVNPKNLSSIRLFEKSGFHRSGLNREGFQLMKKSLV